MGALKPTHTDAAIPWSGLQLVTPPHTPAPKPRGPVLKKIVNLPFLVLSRAARAVQAREEATMRARHGEGTQGDDFHDLSGVPALDVPPDFQTGSLTAAAGEVLTWAADGMDMALVDLRTEADFDAGHAMGAMGIPLNALAIRLSELPPEGTRLVLYGDEAKTAARFLRFRGLDDAWALAGGFAAWKDAGGPTKA